MSLWLDYHQGDTFLFLQGCKMKPRFRAPMSCSHAPHFVAALFIGLNFALTATPEIVRASESSTSETLATVINSPTELFDFASPESTLVSQTVFRTGPYALRTSNGLTYPNGQSGVRLVSLDDSSEVATVAYEDQVASSEPIYTPQQPEATFTDGNVYTGPSATRGTWVLIAPYGWIAGINGQVTVGNRAVNVDITPGQVLSHLGSVDGALMLHAEVGRGDWGFILDGNIIRASTSVSTVPAQVDVSLQQTLIEALGMYRLVDASDFLVEGKSLTLDLLAGGRYYQFANQFTVYPNVPGPPAFPLDVTSSWVDMVIGARTRVPITTSIDAFARADIGGFGIGSSSTFAWNVIAGVDWKMTSCSSLILGYRDMNINRYTGSGLVPFGFNGKLYGPFMAIAFQF